MAECFYLREQAERRRGLARDSADATLRGSFFKPAEEHIARAVAQETDDPAV